MLKRNMAIVGIIIVALIAVILIRTALFKSIQPAVKPAEPVSLDMAGAAERFSKAIRFKTISYQDRAMMDREAFAGFNAYLDQAFPEVRGRLTRETVNGYSLLYTWKGTDPKARPILLMGHSDVVPVEPGTEKDWTHPPFSGDVAGGFVWGRGAQDIKVNVMSMLEAIEYLLKKGYRPKRTVYFAVGHTEEVRGQDGNGMIAKLLESRGVRLEMVVDEGGFIARGMIAGVKDPVALVGTAEKGYLSLELTVTEKGGHSAMPPKETAVGILCAAVNSLEKNQYPLRLQGVTRQMLETVGPEMPFGNRLALANLWLLSGIVRSQLGASPSMAAVMHTTIAPTMLQGSMKENVLPVKATGVVNFRIFPGETIKSVVERAKSTIADDRVRITVLPEAKEPSPVTDTSLPAYGTLTRTIREVFPGVVVSPFLFAAATDSYFYIPISQSIFRFTPMINTSESLAQVHGTNERLSLGNYKDIIRFYIQLIRNMDK